MLVMRIAIQTFKLGESLMKNNGTCPACHGALYALPTMRTKVFYECVTCRRVWELNALVRSGFKFVAMNQYQLNRQTNIQNGYFPKTDAIPKPPARTLLSYAADPTTLPLVQQFELKWDVIAAWMQDARKYSNLAYHYRDSRANAEKNRCYDLISHGLYEQFKAFGTCGTRCIIIRDPNTKPVNREEPFGTPKSQLDLRFGPMQYLALKYPANDAVITTLPYAGITQFFPKLNPWSEYFPHLNLDEITATFAAIETAAVKLPTLNFDENIEESI